MKSEYLSYESTKQISYLSSSSLMYRIAELRWLNCRKLFRILSSFSKPPWGLRPLNFLLSSFLFLLRQRIWASSSRILKYSKKSHFKNHTFLINPKFYLWEFRSENTLCFHRSLSDSYTTKGFVLIRQTCMFIFFREHPPFRAEAIRLRLGARRLWLRERLGHVISRAVLSRRLRLFYFRYLCRFSCRCKGSVSLRLWRHGEVDTLWVLNDTLRAKQTNAIGLLRCIGK